jgi:diguanylate cyclase
MKKQIIQDISKKTLKEIEKFDYLPYPYYYTKIFNSILKEIKEHNVSKELLLEDYLDEAQLTKTKTILEKFDDSNEKITKVSNNFFEDIKAETTIESVKNIIGKFESDLIGELEKSNEEVKSLKKELELAYKKLKIDPLTKTLNRGALDDDLSTVLSFGENRNLDMFLVIIDLDDFKIINDSYGHIVGDKILISIAKIFMESTRVQDKVYRYGGDEFVILFNRSSEHVVKATAKRILEKINHTVFKIQDLEIKITNSIGIAAHKKGDTIDTLITRADEALYETKKSGKNAIRLK